MATALQKARVLVIAGTTAVGKTDLSLELAKRINGEIVSADSVQVYRHMNIGSAKVDLRTQAEVHHHLINVADLKDGFNAGDYFQLAKSSLEDIISRGKTPIVVGGTSFYIEFLLSGSTGAPVSTEDSRAAVERFLGSDRDDWEKCLDKLRELDPDYASSLSPNDWHRLKRALDIHLQSGRTVTSFKKKDDSQCLPYEFKCLFLTMPRLKLFNRIDFRCERLIQTGLLKETASLVHFHGLKPDSTAGNSIGYRQSLEYLSNSWDYPIADSAAASTDYSQPEMKKKFLEYLFHYQAQTRQLARRQLVWFRKDPRFQWVNMAPNGVELALSDVAEKLRLWLYNEADFPSELDGTVLKSLTKEEMDLLKLYSADEYSRLQVYNNDSEIDYTLKDLKDFLQALKKN